MASGEAVGAGGARRDTGAAPAAAIEERVRARLRPLREERGLTLAEVARAAAMAPSTVSRLETGARRLTLAHLAPLARALGVTADELLAPADPTARPRRSAWTTSDGVTVVPLGAEPRDGPRTCKLLLPEHRREPAPGTHAGSERLHVLSGRLRLVLGERERVLRPGERIAFSTWLPHWSGVVAEPVELLATFDPRD